MTSITDILNRDTNFTQQLKAKTDTVTGAASSKLNQSDFLDLLTKQLQFQDPMEPQGNNEFISQMCQFSQLEATTDMNQNFTEYMSETKANNLVGKGVVLADPNKQGQIIKGTVKAAFLDGSKSAINVNGTNYSMEYLLYSYDPTLVGDGTDPSSGGSGGSGSGGSGSGGSST